MSLKCNEYYVGSSSKPEKRLKEHNNGKVIATKHKAPYKIMLTQAFKDEKKARQIERKLKKWKRRDFIERIIIDGTIKSV